MEEIVRARIKKAIDDKEWELKGVQFMLVDICADICNKIEEALEKKQSYTKGIVDEHNRIVRIIEDMKETAEANMMFRHADACECILKAIEEVEND